MPPPKLHGLFLLINLIKGTQQLSPNLHDRSFRSQRYRTLAKLASSSSTDAAATTASTPPSSSLPETTDNPSLSNDKSFIVDSYSPRAGEDGFSVLRQPMTRSNWDPDAPVFVEPSTIDLYDDDDDNPGGARRRWGISGQQDATWWQQSKQRSEMPSSIKREDGYGSSSSISRSSSSINSGARQPSETSEQEELDLFRRSIDTLDYPKVLQALVRECSTVPAKRIVQQSLRQQQSSSAARVSTAAASSTATTTTTTTTTTTADRRLRAYQPLAAGTWEGSCERYRAVQELTTLLNARRGEGAEWEGRSFRDARGYKQSALCPPPTRGQSCNLEQVFGSAEEDGGATPAAPRRVLDGDDICLVRDLLDAMQTVKNWGDALRECGASDSDDAPPFVELPKLTDAIAVNATLRDLLNKAFETADNRSGSEQRRLSGDTFPALKQLRARVQALRGEVLATLEGMLALPSTQNKLALESGGSLYSEVAGRLVIPVQSRYAAMGIVHDTSRSGKTAYVEPTEIVGPTNELRQAEGELRAEEARIWKMLSSEVYHNKNELEASASAVGQLDLVHAKYQLGRKLKGVVPEVQNEGVISVQNAKHPVLLLRELDVVGSTIELGADGNQGLVLTGPNSGGKTIVLKLLGLLAHMSRAGIPIPVDAQRPRVDFFDPILADIGDIQSVGGDLSTFSGHMLVCREILRNARENSLILCDELGSGTDPNQGVALAQAILEELLEKGCRVAITTHFLQLKQLAASDPRFAVGGMQFVNGRPTYKLLPGTVGESFALAVAERLELPRHVVDRASSLMDSETRQMGDLIRELEDQKALVDMQVEELEQRKQEMTTLEQQLREEMVRLERKQLQARREEAKKFARALEEKEKVLESILDKLKSDPSRRVVAKSWEDIKFVKRDAIAEAENIPSVMLQKRKAEEAMDQVQAELVPIADLVDPPALQPGDKVVICKKGPLLGREASLTKNLGSRVEVSVNNMNVGFKLTEVALPPRGRGGNTSGSSTKDGPAARSISKTAERALREERVEQRATNRQALESTSRPKSAFALRTETNTVDVRGCNLDEAKTKAMAAFSRCLMSGRPVVYILHGHGTGGILKAKIRSWLQSERSLVKSFQPADRSDGGDAFTRVELR